MSTRTGPACERHRPALLDLVDGGLNGPGTAAAIDHLGRCPTCDAELRDTALAIAALKGLAREAAAVAPPDDAWPRLRAELQRPPRRAPAAHSPLVGLAMSVALVAVLGLRMVSTPAATETGIHIQPSTTFQDSLEPRIVRVSVGADPAALADGARVSRRQLVDGGSRAFGAAGPGLEDGTFERRAQDA